MPDVSTGRLSRLSRLRINRRVWAPGTEGWHAALVGVAHAEATAARVVIVVEVNSDGWWLNGPCRILNGIVNPRCDGVLRTADCRSNTDHGP
jgi:hypothetical protein